MSKAQKYIDAGWHISQASFYDEEGIEGWIWYSPENTPYEAIQ